MPRIRLNEKIDEIGFRNGRHRILTPTSFLTIHGAAFSSSFNVGRDAGSIGPRTDISEVVAMASLKVCSKYERPNFKGVEGRVSR